MFITFRAKTELNFAANNKSPVKVNNMIPNKKSKLPQANTDLISTISHHKLKVKFLIYLKDKKQLLSTSDDLTIRFWMMPEGVLSNSIDKLGPVYSIIYLKNRNSLAIALQDNNIIIYDLALNKKVFLPKKHSMNIIAMMYMKCKKLLISGSCDRTILVWDMTSCIYKLEGHSESVTSLCHVNNDIICSGSMDNSIKVWNYVDQKCLTTITGHTKPVKIVRFISIKQMLLSGSDDRTIRIFNISNLNKVLTVNVIKCHNYAITDLIF